MDEKETKYICRCSIKRFSKATCSNMIEVPTFRTYPSGYKGQSQSKTEDSVERYCADGVNWCPDQETVERS